LLKNNGCKFRCKVGEVDVRDAFKFNAWTQLNGMTQENAKKQYIKLVENIVNNQNK